MSTQAFHRRVVRESYSSCRPSQNSGRRPQVARQAESGIGGEALATVQDVIEASGLDVQRGGQLPDAHAQRFENVLA